MDTASRGAAAVKELFHYGVPGMKWGVRKKSSGSSGPEPVTYQQRRAGAKIETKGGTGKNATDEAIKTAVTKQVAKKSGVAALSNKDLQEAVNRMNLEQQFGRLTEAQKSPGQKFVNQLLINAGKQQAQTFVNQQAGAAIGSYMGKRATRS